MNQPEIVSVLSLLSRVAPGRYWRGLSLEAGFRRRGIFSLPVVVWMMIAERVQANGSMASVVSQLRSGAFRPLLQPCKRVRSNRISAATGGYCQARQKLGKLVIVRIMDDVFERLRAALAEGWPGLRRQVFILDGSTVLLQHRPELVSAYPPAENQHGKSHWPVLRITVAHDVESGLAVRPAWGPQTTSEQKLAEEIMARLPAGSVVMGDRNFGVFSTAWHANQHGHPVLFRLNSALAGRLLGRKLGAGTDHSLLWHPSPSERRAHPAIPSGASLSGRLIVCELKGARDPLLYFFTTLDLPVSEILNIYALRWNIETDLRSLKRTVRLQHIRARSLKMMEKDLLIAVLAYNLVRTVMCLAARKADISPRHLSFTSIYNLVQTHLPRLLCAHSDRQWHRELNILIDYATDYKLPNRSKRRSYPRAVWGSGFRFASRKHDEN